MKRRVYKFATGQDLPEGAEYLCTQVETQQMTKSDGSIITVNALVWHYYEVEVPSEGA